MNDMVSVCSQDNLHLHIIVCELFVNCELLRSAAGCPFFLSNDDAVRFIPNRPPGGRTEPAQRTVVDSGREAEGCTTNVRLLVGRRRVSFGLCNHWSVWITPLSTRVHPSTAVRPLPCGGRRERGAYAPEDTPFLPEFCNLIAMDHIDHVDILIRSTDVMPRMCMMSVTFCT